MGRQQRDERYQIELGEVLRTRDLAALRAFLETNAARFGNARQVEEVRQKTNAELEEMMHRMILARRDLVDLHAASRQWLFERGIDSYGPGGRRRN